MNAPAAKQDIDSGTGEVITPGEPVAHVDIEDGVSVGHRAEPPADPPADIHEPGQTVSEKPGVVSRDDIYGKYKSNRKDETDEALAGMDEEGRAHYHRMVAEAEGVTDAAQDPFDGDGNLKEGWVDTGAAPAQVVTPGTPIVDATGRVVTPAVDIPPEMTTIVVYGKKQDVPTAEIDAAGGLANYQKNVAADERMARLSTYEASLRAFDQRLQTQAAETQPPQATDTTAASEPPPTGAQDETVDVQTMAEKLVGAMYTGDREAAITEAAEVLTSFRDGVTRSAQAIVAQAGAQSPSLAEQQITFDRAATQKAERDEANLVFVDEFKDLAGPVLKQATYQMVQTVAAEPIMYGRPLAEVTREAGTRVRAEVFGSDYQPPDVPAVTLTSPVVPSVSVSKLAAPTDLAARMALKSRTVVQPLIPAGGARFTEPADASQKTETNSEYIARMKRDSRGQGS